ncbi:MAG: MOSC domain-containing protein [Anaerolineae bacterium]|nr:MOSC domain-containing protein [Anaerolineae bacterium]
MEGIVTGVSRSATYSFSKQTQEAIRLVAGLGVEGDAHMGETVRHRHLVRTDPTRPNLRQVHLLQAEVIDELQAGGFDVSAGKMGENITTRGIDLLSLPVGTRLFIGDTSVVAMTELRDPCGQLDDYQQGLKEATVDRDAQGNVIRKAGAMGVVVMGGIVKPGDAIRVELPAEPHVAMTIG